MFPAFGRDVEFTMFGSRSESPSEMLMFSRHCHHEEVAVLRLKYMTVSGDNLIIRLHDCQTDTQLCASTESDPLLPPPWNCSNSVSYWNTAEKSVTPVTQDQDACPVKIEHICDISKSLKCSTSNSYLPYEQQRSKPIHIISCYEISRLLQLSLY